MAKTYMSVLGTTDYHVCRYYIEDQAAVAPPTRFVQEATIRRACADWSKEDRIIILTTDQAFQKNWRDNGHPGGERKGLERCIMELGLPCKVERVHIPEGKDLQEIWKVFQHIESCLPDQGDVVFDITHGFRSLPMLAIVALNYAKAIKRIHVAGIFYGALEALGTPPEIRAMPEADRLVPIFDLTGFDLLMDWSAAVDRFVVSGDGQHVADLAVKGVRPILSATKGKDEIAVSIRGMADALKDFCSKVATCRGRDIAAQASRVKRRFSEYLPGEASVAFDPLIRRIQEPFRCFQGSDVSDGIEAARWCYAHNLIQQGYTILQETLVTAVVGLIGGDPLERAAREAVTWAAAVTAQGKRDMTSSERTEGPLFKRCLEFFSENDSFARLISGLSGYRNDFNHGGWTNDPRRPERFVADLKEFIEQAVEQPAITRAMES